MRNQKLHHSSHTTHTEAWRCSADYCLNGGLFLWMIAFEVQLHIFTLKSTNCHLSQVVFRHCLCDINISAEILFNKPTLLQYSSEGYLYVHLRRCKLILVM